MDNFHKESRLFSSPNEICGNPKVHNAEVFYEVRRVCPGFLSTEEQAKEGYSLAAQTDKIVEYIKNKRWTYSEVYCDDGYTASKRRRPALERMLDDAAAKQFEAVLVYKIDCLSGNLKDLIEIVEELAKNGAGSKSITELINTTTPEGRLMFHQFNIAEKEAKIVRLMFELYLNKNYGVVNVARYPNDINIKTRHGVLVLLAVKERR